MRTYKQLLVAALMLLASALGAEALTMKDFVLSQSIAGGVGEMIPANDGNNYYELSDDCSRIVKRSYRTGEDVAVVFNSATARDCKVDYWEGFEMSDDEMWILLWTNKEKIYRHSFKADYYVYEVRHNKLTKLSEAGGEEIATMSPDARMVAFVKDNNVYVNLFMSNTSTLDVKGKKVTIEQTTEYPWNGDIAIKVGANKAGQWGMKVRIPGWVRKKVVQSKLY